MRIAIDAPAVRSLSANEKMVYQFLRQGLTVKDIAHRMKLPVGKNNFFDNRYDVPNETVMGLVTSIREKGWDIPTDNNKEEAEMAKITEEQKREIVQLAMTKAMSHKDIAAKFGIGKSTVWWLVDQYKKSGDTALMGETEIAEKEPETAATESGSEENVVSNDSADIVTPSEENVKCEDKKSETVIPQAVIEACLEKRLSLIAQIEEEQLLIDDWQSQIADINSFLELAKGGAAV